MVSFERVFNETIFEGVEGDDDSDAAREEDLWEHRVQHGFNVLKFLVHSNSEGLKDAGGSGATGVGAEWAGDLGDAGCQISSSLNGIADSSAVGDGGCESGCSRFFAPGAKDGFEFVDGGMLKNRGGGAAFGDIKTHIERSAGVEAEATLLIGELIGGETEIKEHAVDAGDVEFVEDLSGGGVA